MPLLKFWRKTRPANVLDVVTAAGIPLILLCDRKEPFIFLFNDEAFNSLAPGAARLSQEMRNFLRDTAVGYQFLVFLKLIEYKFGDEVAKLLRVHLLIRTDRITEIQLRPLLVSIEDVVRRVDDSDPAKELPFEYFVALTALVLLPASPYFVPPDRRSRNADDLMPGDRCAQIATELLRNCKFEALRVFRPFVQLLELDGSDIQDLRRTSGKGSRFVQSFTED